MFGISDFILFNFVLGDGMGGSDVRDRFIRILTLMDVDQSHQPARQQRPDKKGQHWIYSGRLENCQLKRTDKFQFQYQSKLYLNF